MASKTTSRTSPKQQTKAAGFVSVQRNDHSFSSSQNLKASKPELVNQEKSPKFLQNHTKNESAEPAEKKRLSPPDQNGSVESLVSKMNLSASSPGVEQKLSEAHSASVDNGGSRKASVDQNKKTSEHGSVKNSSVSGKVSDGTSSLAKRSGSGKVVDRVDFVESGKSSMCRGSTSSDISDESSCSSLSSSVNKPHKANDLRWEAIQAVRSRDGVLGLSHFRLLKRLGCGDIGSVYLSELSGTKCYFAMKVMDKASLASRKKLLRAQTEREILQCLDHPFLPTLYTHFETDKFSCLVMEFCPGGDLHSLRQRQPGKYFPEQAVKYDK